MKKNKSIILTLIFVLVFMGCNSNKINYYTALSETVLNSMDEDMALYDMIVFIPGSGCTGCITNAEHYFKKNLTNERIKFIFTDINSKKLLRMLIGEDNIGRSNIFIDEDNIFNLKEYDERNYPYVLQIKDGVISGIAMLDEIS